MKNIITPLIIVIILLLFAQVLLAETEQKVIGKITYVSIEGVYLDAGTNVGLASGDTLYIYRDNKKIATVLVNNVSSQAAAAEIIEQDESIKAGDKVYTENPAHLMQDKKRPEPEVKKVEKKRSPKQAGRIRGNIALSNYLHSDMTDSELGWTRPGLSTRLTIENIGDAGIRFELRHRTRLYHRQRVISLDQDDNEWSHQVYRFAFIHDEKDNATEWGLGRLITPYVRGVGFIDGGYFARSLSSHYKLGLAAGTIPDRENSGLDSDIRKMGAFIAYENGNRSNQYISLSLAISTEYNIGTVSRDFLYLQASYSRSNWLTTFHSAEIDYNRRWRYARVGERISFTNYFGSASISPIASTRIYVSYDLRKNIRYFETRQIPDSLFNDSNNKGVRAGINVRVNDRISLRSSAGIRFRDDDFDNPITSSFSVRLNRFPARRHSLSFFFSYISTQFTDGYRPMAIYRMPLSGRLYLNITGASHIYKTGTETTTNSYADLATSYYFRSGLYLNGSIRQYFDNELQSIELFTELGWSW